MRGFSLCNQAWLPADIHGRGFLFFCPRDIRSFLVFPEETLAEIRSLMRQTHCIRTSPPAVVPRTVYICRPFPCNQCYCACLPCVVTTGLASCICPPSFAPSTKAQPLLVNHSDGLVLFSFSSFSSFSLIFYSPFIPSPQSQPLIGDQRRYRLLSATPSLSPFLRAARQRIS